MGNLDFEDEDFDLRGDLTFEDEDENLNADLGEEDYFGEEAAEQSSGGFSGVERAVLILFGLLNLVALLVIVSIFLGVF